MLPGLLYHTPLIWGKNIVDLPIQQLAAATGQVTAASCARNDPGPPLRFSYTSKYDAA
jgi:hypothetical protein